MWCFPMGLLGAMDKKQRWLQLKQDGEILTLLPVDKNMEEKEKSTYVIVLSEWDYSILK